MLDCIERFGELVQNWRIETTFTFSKLLPMSTNPTQEASSRLDLATSVFQCIKDSTIGHFYPRLLSYFHSVPNHPGVALVNREQYNHAAGWPANGWFEFDKATSNVIRQILLACDANPETSTFEHLEALDPRLVCLVCAEKTGSESAGGLTMSWKRAVNTIFI